MDYELIRSRRRSISICVDGAGQLVVRAPKRASVASIERFIKQKSSWINARMAAVVAQNSKYPDIKLGADAACDAACGAAQQMPYLGAMVDVPGRFKTTAQLAGHLREDARAYITGRVELYASKMQVQYTSIKMSSARKRWGSCSASDSLNFSWRLIMCAPKAIDYVVVHELSHIRHKNHGPAFWNTVARYYPNYKEQVKWLRDNSRILQLL
jgi:predicted metal-dependent hydrolase